jgi:hypothetical protein
LQATLGFSLVHAIAYVQKRLDRLQELSLFFFNRQLGRCVSGVYNGNAQSKIASDPFNDF